MNQIVDFLRENSFWTDWAGFIALIYSIYVGMRTYRMFRKRKPKPNYVGGDYVSLIEVPEVVKKYSEVIIRQRGKRIDYQLSAPRNQSNFFPMIAKGQIDDNNTVFGQIYEGKTNQLDAGLFRLRHDQLGLLEGTILLNDGENSKGMYYLKLFRKTNKVQIETILPSKDIIESIKKNVGGFSIKYKEIDSSRHKIVKIINPMNRVEMGYAIYEYIDKNSPLYNKFFTKELVELEKDKPLLFKDVKNILVIHLISLEEQYKMFYPFLNIVERIIKNEKINRNKPAILLREKVKSSTEAESILEQYKSNYCMKGMYYDAIHNLRDESVSHMVCPVCDKHHCECHTANYLLNYADYKIAVKHSINEEKQNARNEIGE